MELWHFELLEGGLKTLKIKPRQPNSSEAVAFGWPTLVTNGQRQRGERIPPNLAQPISQPNLARCTLGHKFDRVFGS